MKKLTNIITIVLMAIALYGCGGGSSGGSNTTPDQNTNYFKTDKPLNLYVSTLNPSNKKEARVLDKSIKRYGGNELQQEAKLFPLFFLHNNKQYETDSYLKWLEVTKNEINEREDTWSKHQSTSTISTNLGDINEVFFKDKNDIKYNLPFEYKNGNLEILTTPTVNFNLGISTGTFDIKAGLMGKMEFEKVGEINVLDKKNSCEQDVTLRYIILGCDHRI